MTVAEAAAARRNQIPRGIAYMAGSTAMFAGGNAVVKWQLATYPLGEVAFGRTLFALLTVAAIVLPRSGWSVLRTRRYREHLQRGLSQFGSMLCWFLAVSVLSLGSATAIGFAAPLFTTLLSIVILKEKVGIHRWSTLIVGFVGVLIITHPGTGTLTYGALFALANAVLISTVAIAIRRMSMTESTETLTLYQMSVMTLCTAGLLTLGFRAPHLGDALMIALAGVGNGIASSGGRGRFHWRHPRQWFRSTTFR
jgi:drug/metabolite transporter (DMT)-like permease